MRGDPGVSEEAEHKIRRLEAALGSLAEGLLLSDGAGGLEPLNPAGERLAAALAEDPTLAALLARVRGEGEPSRDVLTVKGAAIEASVAPVADLGGVVVVVRDVTEQRRTEQALREEILQVSSREQRWIGQTLHDGLCQQLVGISLLAQGVARRTEGTGAVIATEVVNMLTKAAEDTRRLAKGLCPVALETSGLASALEELAESFEKMYPDLTCRVRRGAGEVFGPQDPIATHLYHIAQEAISNAAKHGSAGQVRLELQEGDGVISLIVENDGVPFAEPDESAGMGLRTMRYRAQMLGAALTITPLDGGGTRVECRLTRESE